MMCLPVILHLVSKILIKVIIEIMNFITTQEYCAPTVVFICTVYRFLFQSHNKLSGTRPR